MLAKIQWPHVVLMLGMMGGLVALEILKLPVPHSLLSAVGMLIMYVLNPNPNQPPPPADPTLGD